MSTGAQYQLQVNSGSADRLLLATQLLDNRIARIRDENCRNPGKVDNDPTMEQIEQTHLIFFRAVFKPFVATAYEYTRTPVTQGVAAFGTEITFSIPQFGDFFNDMLVNFRLTRLADSGGGTARYCDFPGHRIIRRARFEVNNNFLDEYTSDVYNMHYNFSVNGDRRLAWLRCIGQEIPRPMLVNNFATGIREMRYYVNGPQTPKAVHDPLNLYVPLLFWFNEDPRLSIPSYAITYGQRFIKLLLCQVDDICGATGTLVPPQIEGCELIINNIFVNDTIHAILLKRVTFNLIRVHIQQRNGLDTGSDRVKLDELRYPIQTIFFGVIPRANLLPSNKLTDWHKYYYIDRTPVASVVAVQNPVPPPTYNLAVAVTDFETPRSPLDTIAFVSHDIELYRNSDAEFFAQAINYVYGSDKFTASEDPFVYIINFAIYPGNYQPTGYFNTSQTRETYFNYTSSRITPSTPADLIMVAVAINFLIVSNNNAALRYTL